MQLPYKHVVPLLHFTFLQEGILIFEGILTFEGILIGREFAEEEDYMQIPNTQI